MEDIFVKKNITFTIIIPVYNCEEFINKCVISIINQKREDVELILIDDGSADKSPIICENLAKKYENIIVIKKTNTGVSDSRNLGISIANGKYVLFADADDYFEENYFTEIDNIISKYEGIELINFGFYSEVCKESETLSSDLIRYEDKYYNSRDEIKQDFIDLWDSSMLYNVWNKVYIKKIIEKNNIKFPNIYFGEDVEFNKEYLQNIHNFYNSEKAFYHYVRERKGSVTKSFKEDINNYFEKWKISKESYYEFSSRRYIERVLGCIENIYCGKSSFFERYRWIKMIINDDLTRQTIKCVYPTSVKIKIMLIPLKYKLILSSMMMGRMINIIKKKYPAFFNRLKNNR